MAAPASANASEVPLTLAGTKTTQSTTPEKLTGPLVLKGHSTILNICTLTPPRESRVKGRDHGMRGTRSLITELEPKCSKLRAMKLLGAAQLKLSGWQHA